METRELRYFVAVAEELHFGRAAERLGMAQPPLSRAISQLERRLGATLLQRTSRTVSLTAAGEVLLTEARAVLDAVAAAERRTRRAAAAPEGRAGLVLASKAGAANEVVAKLLDRYAAEPGAVPVEVLLCGPGEQERTLRDGRADVGVLHLPYDDTAGLDTEVLLSEEQVVLLPAGHPLDHPRRPPARRPGGPGGPAARPVASSRRDLPRRAGAGGPRPHPAAPADRPGADHVIVPDSARAQLGGGVVAVPLVDAPRAATLIAWPRQSRSTVLAAFVRVATSL